MQPAVSPIPPARKPRRAFLDVAPDMLMVVLIALPSSCRIIGSLVGPPGAIRLWLEGPDLPGEQLGIECVEDGTRKQFRLIADAIIKPNKPLVM